MKIADLNDFTRVFQTFLDQGPEQKQIIEEGRDIVKELVSAPGWLNETLERLILDNDFLDGQWHSVDPNEITLFRSSDRSFSVRAFIWEPRRFYPIHDHGSWGLVGVYFNQARERKFERIDDGSIEGQGEVRLTGEGILGKGGTTYVLPINDGIHQVEAVDDLAAVTIHVYGKPVRTGYIQLYNVHNHTVYRAYPPNVLQRILAIRTLGSVNEPWAVQVLQEARNKTKKDFVKMECDISLSRRY